MYNLCRLQHVINETSSNEIFHIRRHTNGRIVITTYTTKIFFWCQLKLVFTEFYMDKIFMSNLNIHVYP